MSDHYLIFDVLLYIIVLTNTKKSDHEIRMEKIQELDAIREVMRKSESDIEMLKIKRQIESMRSEIEK
jgi:hypothetical protein